MIGRAISDFLARRQRRYFEMLRARGMRIGPNVSIQDGFFFDPSHCYLIEIGANCTLAPNVRLIAHDASTKRLLGFTRLGRIFIEEDCFIGDSVIILPNVTIGRGSIIGAGSVVTKTVPAGSVAVGSPARVLCTVEEYAHRQSTQLASARTFSSDYWVENADKAKIIELACAVKQGTVFIE